MTEKVVQEKLVRRFITIRDMSLWRDIDEIMKHKEYKSFNKVICDALSYGLPELKRQLYGNAEKQYNELSTRDNTQDRFNSEVVSLLKELVLNANINKAMLSSLFNLKEVERYNTRLGQKFADGSFSNTPNFLESFELNGLINLNK